MWLQWLTCRMQFLPLLGNKVHMSLNKSIVNVLSWPTRSSAPKLPTDPQALFTGNSSKIWTSQSVHWCKLAEMLCVVICNFDDPIKFAETAQSACWDLFEFRIITSQSVQRIWSNRFRNRLNEPRSKVLLAHDIQLTVYESKSYTEAALRVLT